MTTIGVAGLAPVFWKVTALLAAAAIMELVLWRRSASLRHLVWSSTLAAILLVPVISAVIPKWTIPVWEDLVPAPATFLFRAEAVGGAWSASGTSSAPAPAATDATASSPARVPWGAILWFAGALAVGLQTLVGGLLVMRLRRTAVAAPENVASVAHELGRGMGLGRPVRLLMAPGTTTPMTWGIWSPIILLPESVVRGETERLRTILVHELAHIRRCDFPVHLLTQAACAAFWFHPLVWLARSRAQRLQERASDDAVLALGARPSEYATALVQLSKSLAAPRLCGSLGICRPSTLESRVRAILNPRLRRGHLTPAVVSITLVIALGVATFTGAASPVLAQSPRPEMPASAVALMMVAAWAQKTAVEAATDLDALEAEAAAAVGAFDLEKAASSYRRAADVKKGRFGVNSAQYAQDLIRLGALYRAWDRLDEARPLYAEALSILESSFGPKYPGLAKPLYFLAMDAHLRDEIATAESLYQRVVDLMEQPPSLETALARRGLSVIAQQRGNLTAEGLAEIPTSGLLELRMMETSVWPTVPSEAVRAGNGVSTPVLISKVEPQYSREARLAKYQGPVILRAIVAADGRVREVRVQKSLGLGLDAKAVEAVRQWRFQPGTKDGAPVPVAASIEVNFRLM